MNHESEKTVTFTWQDPLASAKEGLELSGLEYLRRITTGDIPPPPIMVLMNIKRLEIEEGRAVFYSEPQEYHYNPIGSVHGGYAATLLDSAMACAVHSLLPAGTGYTTLEIKVNYIRPLSGKTGLISSIGKVIHVGGSAATAEGSIVDGEGKLYAHATTTCLIMRPKK